MEAGNIFVEAGLGLGGQILVGVIALIVVFIIYQFLSSGPGKGKPKK